MNYKDFNDFELLDNIYSLNEDANEILLYKYRPLIVNVAKKMIKYCSGGVDLNDLIQEGMLGLNEAINAFREDKDTNFGTYAKLCIERKMISIVKSTRTYKNKILNESVSLEDELELNHEKFLADNTSDPFSMISENEYEEKVLNDFTLKKILGDNSQNPENLIVDVESMKELLNVLDDELSDFEKQVFELKKNDFNYKEIADILDKDPKAIDNAIQRIKTKLKKVMSEIDE